MTVSEVTLTTWRCDGRGFRVCGQEVRTTSATEMPPGWIALDWFESDPKGGSLGGKPLLVPKVLHFHETECLAWWMGELPITVGMKINGTGNAPRKVNDAAGWHGRSPDALYGCPSCKSRDGNHEMGCTLHR